MTRCNGTFAERKVRQRTGLRVEQMGSEGASTCQPFIEAHESANIYLTEEFQDFLTHAVGGEPIWFIARRGPEITGVLPAFVRHNRRWGYAVNSLPWFGSHGGCLVSPGAAVSARADLLAAYKDFLSQVEAQFATIILTPEENNHLAEYYRVLAPVVTDGRISQVTPLPRNTKRPETVLEEVISQKTRNLVRKSCKQGFREWCGDADWAWRFLHRTHHENMRAVGGKAKPWAHFNAMREHIPATWRRLSIALLNDRPVAALLIFTWRDQVEYITPAVKRDFRSLQPLSFLIWRAMTDCRERGARHWNWGGTWHSQRSLHHFKAGWGATDRAYTYLVAADESSLDRLRAAPNDAARAFPYYYLYPFTHLGRT